MFILPFSPFPGRFPDLWLKCRTLLCAGRLRELCLLPCERSAHFCWNQKNRPVHDTVTKLSYSHVWLSGHSSEINRTSLLHFNVSDTCWLSYAIYIVHLPRLFMTLCLTLIWHIYSCLLYYPVTTLTHRVIESESYMCQISFHISHSNHLLTLTYSFSRRVI